MKHVVIEDADGRILPFYLAAEEWVTANLPADEYFFAWQVEPTVICGRNQQMELEVDLDYCGRNGIEVYRRKSGGGCVFADRNNIMFSYITPDGNVGDTFRRYTSMVCAMLRSLGFDAVAGGRNDVFVGGRKVAGNAFYHTARGSIVHGTMLYDTDHTHMAHAITPSRAKLLGNKVQSVESRITTLRAEGIEMSCDEFRRYAVGFLTDGTATLPAGAVDEIERISRTYLTASHIVGRRARLPFRHSARAEGVGEVVVDYNVDACNRFTDINLTGDFFPLRDLDTALIAHLLGVERTPAAVGAALGPLGVENVIAGADAHILTEILTS